MSDQLDADVRTAVAALARLHLRDRGEDDARIRAREHTVRLEADTYLVMLDGAIVDTIDADDVALATGALRALRDSRTALVN